ncbi:MAG TPA: D-glucuronyl C5-epimerase family protein [Conexibacter sp.]
MPSLRLLCPFIVACAFFGSSASALASPVLVMGRDGSVHRRNDAALPSADSPLAELPALRDGLVAAAAGRGPLASAAATTTTPRLRRAAAKAVDRSLAQLLRTRAIDATDYAGYSRTFDDAVATAARLGGSRGAAIQSVLNNTADMARDGALTAPRLPAAFLTLSRNTEWWKTGKLLSYGERVEFNDSELVWEYYPGEGIQLQVLGTFGKANGLWMSKDRTHLRALLDEMTGVASTRGGALAWEYYFFFGGGTPPWASGMAQATGAQVLARASQLLDDPSYLATARQAIRIFQLPAPTGVGVRTTAGRRFLLYSFAPSQQVLNAFIQTLVALNDYNAIARDPRAAALFKAGEAQARLDLRATDTGAWSLYQVGGSEAPLSYQQLVTGFLTNLCDRTRESYWCSAGTRFTSYLRTPPAIELLTRSALGGSQSLVRFTVSKESKVGMTITRDGSTALSTSATVSHGPHGYAWHVPRSPGVYTVTLSGTDLAGNFGRVSATITVTGRARV